MGTDKECSSDLHVESMEAALVSPCRPSPEKILSLSNLDSQQMSRRMLHAFLLYNPSAIVSADPAKVIREALPKALVYYYPLAGRLRNTYNGKLQVECTDQGVLFVEATAHNELSVLRDLKDLKPSFNQLHFEYPPHTSIEDMHLLVLQVTSFKCGGFVVAASFHHSMFDGKGAAQFLRALGELSRGHVKPSTEPVWCRELLKPRDPPRVQYRHAEFIDESRTRGRIPKDDELMQTTIVINLNTISKIKQRLMDECTDLQCTSFDVVASMAWRARTKALQIPYHHIVKVFYAADGRRSIKPPLPQGFYGNAFVILCAVATADKLVNGGLSDVVNIVRKSKLLRNDEYLRSEIDFLEIKDDPLQVYMSQDNLIITDWRWLGFEKADFGWGEAGSVSPVQWGGLGNGSAFLPNKNGDGMKILVCMAKSDMELFQLEMQLLIDEYLV